MNVKYEKVVVLQLTEEEALALRKEMAGSGTEFSDKLWAVLDDLDLDLAE